MSGAPSLRLVGQGGYTVNKGRAATSGSFEITNDTTVTDAIFATASSASMVAQSNLIARSSRSAAANRGDTGVSCLFIEGTFTADPVRQPDGDPGKTGGDGTDGKTWTAACRGDMDVVGEFNVTGQGAGNGGDGTDVAAAAKARGGKGGQGGTLKVLATGELTFSAGSSTTLTSGRGGDGGDALATGAFLSSSAEATGGNGGAPGLIQVRAGDGIDVEAPLNVVIGRAGIGGDATAEGQDGRDGGSACPAQPGGDATAIAGDGGSTPDKTLKAKNVAGLAFVKVSGGEAGAGGTGRGTAGNGGSGAKPCIDGANGGSQHVFGGDGGDALLKDLSGAFVQNGGRGGDAFMIDGSAGVGFNGCGENPPVQGGKGGEGIIDIGSAGVGGLGKAPGAAGTRTLDNVGNGGNGGDGDGPGDGKTAAFGPGPTPGATVAKSPSFKDGVNGAPCPKKPAIGASATPQNSDVPKDTIKSLRAIITVTPTNYNGPIVVTPLAAPSGSGIRVSPASVTLRPGQTQAAFDVVVAPTQAGDFVQTFSVTGSAVTPAITTQASIVVHAKPASSSSVYNIDIQEASTPGNDASNMGPSLAAELVRRLTVAQSGTGTAQQLTISGLVLCGVPFVLTNSGPEAFSSNGSFFAMGKATIQMGSRGAQLVDVSMSGTISSTGAITFTFTVFPDPTASYQFGRVQYVGQGTKG